MNLNEKPLLVADCLLVVHLHAQPQLLFQLSQNCVWGKTEFPTHRSHEHFHKLYLSIPTPPHRFTNKNLGFGCTISLISDTNCPCLISFNAYKIRS